VSGGTKSCCLDVVGTAEHSSWRYQRCLTAETMVPLSAGVRRYHRPWRATSLVPPDVACIISSCSCTLLMYCHHQPGTRFIQNLDLYEDMCSATARPSRHGSAEGNSAGFLAQPPPTLAQVGAKVSICCSVACSAVALWYRYKAVPLAFQHSHHQPWPRLARK
jgi:hypothetical protein